MLFILRTIKLNHVIFEKKKERKRIITFEKCGGQRMDSTEMNMLYTSYQALTQLTFRNGMQGQLFSTNHNKK